MMISSAVIKLQVPWVHSLKEKRMVVKSVIEKAKNRFNISIAEVDAMDVHQTIMLGICCVSNSRSHADSVIEKVVNFIEDNTEAVVEDVNIEIF